MKIDQDAKQIRTQFDSTPRTVYGGDMFAYDSDTELVNAQGRARQRQQARRVTEEAVEEKYVNLFSEGALWRSVVYGNGHPEGDPSASSPTPRESSYDLDRDAWTGVRDRILRRDGFVCRRCNVKKQKADLSVHHILPRSEGGSSLETNLVALCHPCHDFVECTVPPVRTLAAVIGSDVPQREFDVLQVREEVAGYAGRRKPHGQIYLWAEKLSGLGLGRKAIADLLEVSDSLLRKAWGTT